MKLTTARLKKLIREELARIAEQEYGDGFITKDEKHPMYRYQTNVDALEPDYNAFMSLDFSEVKDYEYPYLDTDKIIAGVKAQGAETEEQMMDILSKVNFNAEDARDFIDTAMNR